jgi:hypothetical protein
MSYAPESILQARRLIQGIVPSLSNAELGIVGDDAHANSGTGYHIGEDALKAAAYSVVESSRDRNGLTNAASALDVGWFTVPGQKRTLRDMSKWIVAECEANALDTRDIREIIYSPDGRTVKRWDRLKARSSGDDSHLSHTHFSFFRDSESRDKTSIFRRWFVEIGAMEDGMALTLADGATVWKTDIIPNPAFRADAKDNPATTACFALGDVWRRVGEAGQKLDALSAKVDALGDRVDAPAATKDEVLAAIRAEIRAIVRDGVA